MKVMHLIDSLQAGGAERMAVNCVNELVSITEGAYLCVTRKEGPLRTGIDPGVEYLFLEKRRSLDLKALFRLIRYLRKNEIDILHAHSTSYFLATLVKIFYPRIKIIWHEHHGKRIEKGRWQNKILFLCSFFFSAIITVNKELFDWSLKHLKTKEVVFIPNFVSVPKGEEEVWSPENRIICLANLRPPKNHLNLLESFIQVHEKNPDWELLLIGRKEDSGYVREMEEFIAKNNLNTFVRIFGESNSVAEELQKAKIGVLSSNMEGLPMALLEYGMAGLAVVATDVGQCKSVIGAHGLIVPSGKPKALADALNTFIIDERLREMAAAAFRRKVMETYSWQAIGPLFIKIYKETIA